SCQAQKPVLGNPSGLVPLGLTTKMFTSGPETPNCAAALSASAAMSAWLADCGAGAESSTQVPPSTEPLNVTGLPLPSVYCVMDADQPSLASPRPLNRLCMYCCTP